MSHGYKGAGRPTSPRGRRTLPVLPSLERPLPVLTSDDQPKPKRRQEPRVARETKALPRPF